MAPKLSICIPTYNRADCLPTALDSVLKQMTPRTEIVICDNGSTDTTAEVVSSYLSQYKQITYFKFPQNVGPDRCFLQSIDSAKGEYCWLLGDDDLIEEGGIDYILSCLDQNPHLSGISVNRRIFDHTLTHEISKELIQDYFTENKLYHDSESCLKDLFIYFGYLSGQICKRSIWQETVAKTENIEEFFNAFSILYLVAKIVLNHPEWLYVHTPYIRYRADNDSFMRILGAYKRFLIDSVETEHISTALVGKFTPMAICYLNQICKGPIRGHIISIKAHKKVKNFTFKALIILLPRYWKVPSFWTKNIPFLLLPSPLLILVRKGYQKFIKPYKLRKEQELLKV